MSRVRKNGWWLHNSGYVQGRIWENGIKRIVLQHRYIAEKISGRLLNSWERAYLLVCEAKAIPTHWKLPIIEIIRRAIDDDRADKERQAGK